MAGILRLSNTGTGNGQSTITTAASGDTTYTLPSGGGTFVTTASTQALTVPFASGTAGAPSVTFIGDTDTGLYSPGANQVALSTSGTGRLFVDASGRVGIGASPTAKLYLQDSGTTQTTIKSTGGVGRLYIESASGNSAEVLLAQSGVSSFGIKHVGGSNALAIENDGSEKVRLTSDGKLGLGTSSPAYPLDVNGIAKVKQAVLFEAANSTNRWDLYTNTDNTFRLNYNGSGNDEITIDSSGRVGIGTTSPQNNFVVSNGGNDGVEINPTGENSDPAIYSYSRSGDGYRSLTFVGLDYRFNAGSSPTERARIDSSGRLLVGTSTATGRLSVAVADGTTTVFSAERTGGSPASLTLAFTNQETNWASSVRYNLIAGGSGGVTLASGATSWAAISDERLKTDLIDIQDGLNKITSLRAVTGRYISDSEETRRAFLIAQDVQTVLPEAVDSSNPDELRLLYTEVIPLLVSALKESKERIETLEAKVAALESA